MNSKTLLLSLSGLTASAGLAFGQWTIVNSFDDASALSSVSDNINIEGSGAMSSIEDGMWAVNPGDLFESTSNIYAMLDLGVDLKAASIANAGGDGTVTLYVEVMQPLVDDGSGGMRKAIVDHVWGLSNIDEDTVLTDRYNSYNAMQRVSAADSYDGRNAGDFVSLGVFEPDVKYSIWFVLDYNLNFYQTYIQGGAWTDQTLLDAGDMSGIWLFRVNPSAEQTVDKFMIAVSRGNSVDGEKAVDSLLFDNVAIDTAGTNLSAPDVGLGPADWSVVNTFDDAGALATVSDNINIEGSGAMSSVEDGMWKINPGDLFETTSNIYAMQDLGTDLKAASIAAGGAVSLYVEVMQPTVDDGMGGTRKAIVDHVWGLSNIDEDTVLTDRYNSYNAMQRVSAADSYDGRNAGDFVALGTFEADVKYSIWFHLDYTLNFYQTWIQGGAWTEQTLLDAGDMSGIWLFRVNPSAEQTVDKFMIAVSRGNSIDGEKAVDSLLFDNIAIDTAGVNASVPMVDDVVTPKGPGYFGNYDVVMEAGEMWVNTGAWMGWVNVENYPYVYILGPDASAPFDNWAYVADSGAPENKDATGAWMYQFQ